MRCGVALYAGGGKVSLSPAAKMSSALAKLAYQSVLNFTQ